MKIYKNYSGCHLSILRFPAAFNSAGANQEREEQTKKSVRVENSGVALSFYLQHSVVRSLADVCSDFAWCCRRRFSLVLLFVVASLGFMLEGCLFWGSCLTQESILQVLYPFQIC